MLMTTSMYFLTMLYVKCKILFLLEAKRLSVPCFDVKLFITVSFRKLN